MTYSIEQYLADQERAQAQAEALESAMHRDFPGWEDRETDPEDRDIIAYNDVADPDEPSVRIEGRYGAARLIYIAGAYMDPWGRDLR
ncbi:MAG TPA: hypothetical protein VGP24_01155 [Glaciihabitans sp.]|jgi:hypothetical protein|nr:hypothetical protein [Glaciihabitans sp.]